MTFNSVHFLVFFGLFYSAYLLTSGRVRLAITLVASCIFYGYWDWRFLGLLTLSTIVDYLSGRLMGVVAPGQRKPLLGVSIAVNLVILGFFKYFNFFLDSAMDLLAWIGVTPHVSTLSIILPVGISFYTFQNMSYTIDVYRKNLPVEKDLLVYATYVAIFPQLVAGPIVRASTLLPQLHTEPRITWHDLLVGFEWILWGYVLKLCLADNAAPFVETAFAQPHLASSLHLLVAVPAFAFQIYGDFARLLPHRHWPGAPAGARVRPQFRYALFRHELSQLLAALAYLLVDLAARLSLHPARGESGGPLAGMP